MNSELLEKCNRCIREASLNQTLVGNGNTVFSEDEYAEMLDYVSFLFDVYKDDNQKNDSIVFITLVEIAKRWKNTNTVGEDTDSGFWGYVFKTLFGRNEVDQKIRNAFVKIISRL